MALSKLSGDDDLMSEINVTPLVDVMLVLLVTFIVTAPLLTQAVGIHLPKTARTTATTSVDHPLVLSINREGAAALNGKPVAAGGLEAALAVLAAHGGHRRIQLEADTAVPYGTVAQAMAAAERAGFTSLAVITRQP